MAFQQMEFCLRRSTFSGILEQNLLRGHVGAQGQPSDQTPFLDTVEREREITGAGAAQLADVYTLRLHRFSSISLSWSPVRRKDFPRALDPDALEECSGIFVPSYRPAAPTGSRICHR